MQYQHVENVFTPPPKPVLNGGLYTGKPFADNAPWANVPVIPDVSYMIHKNLKSAHPPPGAEFQYPGGNRPGNNTQIMPGVQQSKNNNYSNFYCNAACGPVDNTSGRFFKYASWNPGS